MLEGMENLTYKRTDEAIRGPFFCEKKKAEFVNC